MSSLKLRHIFKNLVITRLFSGWTRSCLVSAVVKRCRKDRGVREVIQCFRQVIAKPKRTLLLSATAAYKSNEEKPGPPGECSTNITDEELQALVTEFDGVEELAQATLYCTGCAKRVIIDKKQPGVRYCACKDAEPPKHAHDGWVPYMEAEDVIIWRKEYKRGKGLFAYKVYGRYKEIRAQDFAAVQVDGGYRRKWDSAVAALSIVERQANGIADQVVLHWEVLWPRLFANRDYVYIRRHREFDVKTKCLTHKEGIFEDNPCTPPIEIHERPSVHSNAKRKSMENESMEVKQEIEIKDNKAYIIISRSCVHPQVPETKNAIRVLEYWSHMVVKTLDGPDKPGTEFVLTYYDEPAVGGMPTGVASWATGRAAPAFLARMRRAAHDYRTWRARHDQKMPDFTPFGPEKVSYEDNKAVFPFNEQDMESSKQGPDMEHETKDQSTQTDEQNQTEDKDNMVVPKYDKGVGTKEPTEPCEGPEECQEPKEGDRGHSKESPPSTPRSTESKPAELSKSVASDAESIEKEDATSAGESETEETENTGGWWRYLYPFYYFV